MKKALLLKINRGDLISYEIQENIDDLICKKFLYFIVTNVIKKSSLCSIDNKHSLYDIDVLHEYRILNIKINRKNFHKIKKIQSY